MARVSRKSVYVEGYEHKSPIPAACLMGKVLVTGNIYGRSFDGSIPESPEAQVELLFSNLERIMVAAGASMGNVIKISIKVRDMKLRSAINKVWEMHFPDRDMRPVRQVSQYDHLSAPFVLSCEAMAVLE